MQHTLQLYHSDIFTHLQILSAQLQGKLLSKFSYIPEILFTASSTPQKVGKTYGNTSSPTPLPPTKVGKTPHHPPNFFGLLVPLMDQYFSTKRDITGATTQIEDQ